MGMLQPVGGNSADVDYLRSEEEKARRARVYKTGQNRGFASSTVLAGPDERNLSMETPDDDDGESKDNSDSRAGQAVGGGG